MALKKPGQCELAKGAGKTTARRDSLDLMRLANELIVK